MELCKAYDGSQQSCCKSCFHAVKAGRCTILHRRWKLSKVLLLVFLQKLVGGGGQNASPGSRTSWYACIKCHHRRPVKIQPCFVILCCIRRDVPTDLQCLLHSTSGHVCCTHFAGQGPGCTACTCWPMLLLCTCCILLQLCPHVDMTSICDRSWKMQLGQVTDQSNWEDINATTRILTDQLSLLLQSYQCLSAG